MSSQMPPWQRFDFSKLGATPAQAATARGAAQPAQQPGTAARAGAQTTATQAAANLAEDAARRAGYQAGSQRAEAEAKRLAALGASFARSLRETEAEVAERVLDVAIELARQVLVSDISLRREALLPVVREALQALPESGGRAQLVVNPADVDLIRARAGEELAQNGWTLVEDHRIQPGGCRVSAANCDVDATLAKRWKRALAAIGKDAPWGAGGDD